MKTILLVEDSKLIQVATKRLLTKAGYEVTTADDGEQALKMVHNQPPTVILLDMMLPRLSGPEVLAQLKQNPETAHIPVIVLSGLSRKNEQRLLSIGAAGFVEKSLSIDNPNHLLDSISKALGASPAPPQSPIKIEPLSAQPDIPNIPVVEIRLNPNLELH